MTAEVTRLACAEIWGGIGLMDSEVCTRGLSASVYSRSADGVAGGDIYYFSVCSADKLTRVAIADVRGHGEEVSPLSQWLFEGLEKRMNSLDGAGVLEELNTQVRERGFKAMTTAAVLGYYTSARRLYFSSAGHHPFLLRRSDGVWKATAVEGAAAGPANLPLGVLPAVRYDQSEVPVEAGDRIFLCTDGVLECPDKSGEFFGEEGVIQFLEECSESSLAEAKSSLINRLVEFSGGDLTHDDCTFLFLEVLV